jgi:hypothetical protein
MTSRGFAAVGGISMAIAVLLLDIDSPPRVMKVIFKDVSAMRVVHLSVPGGEDHLGRIGSQWSDKNRRGRGKQLDDSIGDTLVSVTQVMRKIKARSLADLVTWLNGFAFHAQG